MSDFNLKIYRPSTALVIFDALITCAVVGAVLIPLLTCVSYLLHADLIAYFFPAYAGVFIGALVVTSTSWTLRSISVSNKAISGGKHLAVGRSGFLINEIDIEKSRRRTCIQKLFGTQIIESKSGEKIVFYRRVFKHDDINEVLTRCNLNMP